MGICEKCFHGYNDSPTYNRWKRLTLIPAHKLKRKMPRIVRRAVDGHRRLRENDCILTVSPSCETEDVDYLSEIKASKELQENGVVVDRWGGGGSTPVFGYEPKEVDEFQGE